MPSLGRAIKPQKNGCHEAVPATEQASLAMGKTRDGTLISSPQPGSDLVPSKLPLRQAKAFRAQRGCADRETRAADLNGLDSGSRQRRRALFTICRGNARSTECQRRLIATV
jgi:hypothetical protein